MQMTGKQQLSPPRQLLVLYLAEIVGKMVLVSDDLGLLCFILPVNVSNAASVTM